MARRPSGIRARSAAAFAGMALVLSACLSMATYQLTRTYLLNQREALALREATLNALTMRGQLSSRAIGSAEIVEALQGNNAPAVLRAGDSWYSAVVQFDEDAVPISLRQALDAGPAGRQRAIVDGDPYLIHGFNLPGIGAQYYEFASAAEYERTLTVLAGALALAASVTTIAGAASGWFLSRRVLRPLGRIAQTARSISSGNLSHRLDAGADSDLRPVADAFNDMTASLESMIERERRFTADVSHELRTPLTSLSAAVGLAKRTEMGDRGRYAIEIVDEQVAHLTRLTVELLEISRLDVGDVTLNTDPLDIVDVLIRVMDNAGVDRRLLVVHDGCPRVWNVDGTRFERIAANLVENAQRYGNGVTGIGLAQTPAGLEMTVDDDGPGVPASERRAIFERFHRGPARPASHVPRGTGLGLSLVEQHVRLHGGEVFVTDAPSGGARFVVQLPS